MGKPRENDDYFQAFKAWWSGIRIVKGSSWSWTQTRWAWWPWWAIVFFLRLYLIYSTHSPCDWCVPNFNFLGSSKKWHNDIDPCENHRITSNMEHFNVISPTQCDFKRFQWSLRRHGRGRAVSVQMPAPGRKQPFSGWHPWLTNYIPSKK